MDRPIEKKKGIALAFTSKALPYWFGAFMAVFILWLIFRDDSSTLRVNGDTLSINEVTSGEFNDYIRISGQVHPMTTIQVSPREAGIVEEIVLEEGTQVKAGDVIIRLSNDDLDLEILNSEANLAEKENALRNTMIQMEQEKMQLSLNRQKSSVRDVPLNRRSVFSTTGSSERRNICVLKKIMCFSARSLKSLLLVQSRTACTERSRSGRWRKALPT